MTLGLAAVSRLYVAAALPYYADMFGSMKRTTKTMTPSDGVARACAC